MKRTDDIKLIIYGFAVAFLGSLATVFYILGFTELFIGRARWGTCQLVLAAVLFALFYKTIMTYLNLLNNRFDAHPSNFDL